MPLGIVTMSAWKTYQLKYSMEGNKVFEKSSLLNILPDLRRAFLSSKSYFLILFFRQKKSTQLEDRAKCRMKLISPLCMTSGINNHQKAQPVHKENSKIKYFEFFCELENYLINSGTISGSAETTKFVFNYEEGNPRRVQYQSTDT